MQAFYGGHPADWFHVPGWQLNVFVAELPQLRAERQLLAIEASLVPHIKPDEAKKIMARHGKALTPPEQKELKATGMSLLDGFREHGLAVVEETGGKPSA